MTLIGWNGFRRQAAVIAVLATPGAVRAQSPVPDLRGFRDSLAAAPGNEALGALERQLILEARRTRGRNAGLHVRLGLIAQRLGAHSDAAAEFKLAAQLNPAWGEAWLGLARAELALGEVADTTRAGRRATLSAAAWSRAESAVSRAILADGSLMPAVVDLARGRVAAGRTQSADVVRMGLRRAVVSRSRNPESFLALGHVERILGDSAAALIAFEAGASLPRGRGPGLLELARLRLALGEPLGVATYYEVAALDDSAAVAGIRADFAWIATAAELEALDAASGPDRATLLRQFWTRRGHEDLRDAGERLGEHYRRIVSAEQNFTNRDDQRVAVWIRHGPPDNRATFRDSTVAVNDSWRFRRPEGDLVVHFRAGADTTNYRLVESVFDLAAPRGAPAADAPEHEDGQLDRVLRSRAQLSPFYQAGVAGRREQLAAFEVRERELSKAGMNLAVTTDRYPLRFERDLVARLRVASLGVDRPALDVWFVLPGPPPAPDSATPFVRVRVVSWSSLDGTATALDTLVVPTVTPDGLLGVARVPVRPGVYDTRVAIEVGDRGTVVAATGTTVAGPDGPRLGDLTVGSRRANLRWSIGGVELVDDPSGQVRRTDRLVVNAVVAGLPSGASVRYRLQARPIRQDGREEKWREAPGGRWTERTEESGGRLVLRVAGRARSLRPGRYELMLEAEVPELGTLRKTGQVVIVEPEK